jgi:Zn-dependent protease with chaperone function
MNTVPAEFFDGQTSKHQLVNLEFTNSNVIVHLQNGETITISLSDVKVQPKLGTIPRVLDFPNNACVHVSDHDTLEKLLPHKRDWIHLLENNWKFVVTSFTSIIVFGLLMYFVIIPWGAKAAAPKMTKTFGESLTKDTITYLETTSLLEKETKSKYEDRLESIRSFEIMQPYAEYKILLYSAPAVGANAFALPNDTIIVTHQLLDLIDDDMEILAILMHEIGHVKKYHVMERIIKDSMVSIIMFSLFGADWTSIPMVVLSTSYSRDVEKEADLYAAYLLRKHNLPASLLGKALERIEDDHYKKTKSQTKSSIFEWISSHPSTRVRVKYLEDLDSKKTIPPP